MTDNAEHPWNTSGERMTTAYGANMSGFNEFGQRCPPKPVINSHGFYVPSDRIPSSLIGAMVEDFHHVTGRLPTKVFLSMPSKGTRFQSFHVGSLGAVMLDIFYNASHDHVE